MTGFEIAALALGGANFLAGIFGSSKSRSEQRAAEEATREEKIRAYEFNIGQTEKDIERVRYAGQEARAETRREGEQAIRGQAAAIGSSGASIGAGSPLMTMVEASESLERDILRLRRLEEMEVEKKESQIEFMEQEIGELSSSEFLKTHKKLQGKLEAGPPWKPITPKKGSKGTATSFSKIRTNRRKY
jgi:hypothetical protein